MQLTKVGDCLSYGLSHEFMDDTSVPSYDYLKSALLYLFINGYINAGKMVKIKNLIYARNRGVGNAKRTFNKMFTVIVAEIKRKINFRTFEELVEKLNQFQIPEWMHKEHNTLFQFMPDICLVNETLYFIEKREKFQFCSLNVKEIEFVRFDVDGLDEYETSRTIAYTYSHILGYNRDLGVMYLSPAHMDDMYVEYHINTRQEVVHHNKCIGMLGNMLLIEDEKYLAIKVGNRITRIKETNSLESYRVDDNGVYVTPCTDGPLMFKPYRISVSGEVTPVAYAEEMEYLWNQIRSGLPSVFDMEGDYNSDEVGGESTWIKGRTFSLRFLNEYFKEDDDYEGNVNARICLFVIRILGKYLDMEQDVLDYFYILLEASRRYDKYSMRGHLGEEVYWRIEELEATGELEKCIYDLNAFKAKLVEYAYWNDTKLDEKRRRDGADVCRVGYFEIDGNRVDAVSVSLEDGICIGNLIQMSGPNREGCVMYNYELGKFIVQYSRLLNEYEIEEIESKFHLDDKYYQIVIERKES